MYKLFGLKTSKDTVEISREWLQHLHHMIRHEQAFTRKELEAYMNSLDLLLDKDEI